MSRSAPRAQVNLRESLDAGDLYVAMQPIVDLRNATVFGLETLLRSRSKAWKGPGEMIKAALEARWMGELGRAIRQMATRTAPDARLFVNIHPEELSEGWLVRPDDPIYFHDHEVFLEITESVPLTHFDRCHSILREVRDRGVRLVVDDLGAGYSNLKYIADLAPEIVKLDRDLVANLDQDRRLRTLLCAMVRLCEDLGAKVVAEGIETADELRVVVDAGVHYGQGYFIARPAFPAPEIDWAVLVGAGVRPPRITLPPISQAASRQAGASPSAWPPLKLPRPQGL